MGRSLKYLSLLIFGILITSCRKPRNGDYVLTETGTKFTNNCPVPSACTTGNESVTNKRTVSVEDSKKHWLYVDGNKWDKDINSVSYYNTFTESYSNGATESFTLNYSGAIKNKFLIEGTYTISTIVTQDAGIYYTTTTGVFSLKVKK